MALGKCVECGREVSSFAKKCPGCGRSNPTLTGKQLVIGWIVLGLAILWGVSWLFSSPSKKEATTSPETAASAAPAALEGIKAPTPKPPSEKAKEMQPRRRQALDKFVAQGIFHGYLRTDGKDTFVVFRVGPAWRGLPLEEKRVVADIAFTYHWVEQPHLTSALLEDWRDGKTVATFSPEWGLQLDD